MASRFYSISIDLLVIIILLISGLKFCFDIERVIDIGHPDATSYLFGGINLLKHGIPNAAYAPLYAVWYFILSLFQQDSVELYYLNYKVLTILIPILVYILLRRHKLSQIPSAIIAFFFLISSINLTILPKPNHFALIIVLLSFIFIGEGKNLPSAVLIAAAGALLTAFVRPEYFITFIVMLFIYFFIIAANFKHLKKRPEIIKFTVFALMALLLIYQFGIPIGGDSNRALLAFSQHFALRWTRSTGSDLNPWTNSTQIVSQTFGHVQSVFDALLKNPPLFIKHVVLNLMEAPSKAFALFFVTYQNKPYFAKIESFVLLCLSVVYIFWKRRQWYTEWASVFKLKRMVFILFSCYLLVSLISIGVTFPRSHYLIVPGVLIIIGVSLLFVDKVQQPSSDDLWKAILFGLILLLVGPYTNGRLASKMHNRATVQFLKSMEIKREVRLMDALGGIGTYVGSNYRLVPEYYKSKKFNQFLKNQEINMIIVSGNLVNDSRYKNDMEWVLFYEGNYAKVGFKKVAIPNSDYELIVEWMLLNKVIFNPLYDSASGFYPLDVWTKGEAMISRINYYLTDEDRFLVLGTRGYHPFKHDFDKLRVRIYVNGNLIQFSHQTNHEYFFQLNRNDQVIDDILIISSTFVPKSLGINEDTRKLGIDVSYIAVK